MTTKDLASLGGIPSLGFFLEEALDLSWRDKNEPLLGGDMLMITQFLISLK